MEKKLEDTARVAPSETIAAGKKPQGGSLLYYALALAAAAAAPFFPLLLCIAPALIVYVAWRNKPYILGACTLVSLAACYLAAGSVVGALLNAALILPAFLLPYLLIRLRYSNFELVFYCALVGAIGLFLVCCVPSLLSGGSAFAFFDTFLDEYGTLVASMETLLTSMGYGELLTSFNETLELLRMNAAEICVSAFFFIGAIASLANRLLIAAFDRRTRLVPLRLPPFGKWQVKRSYVYVMLGLCILGFILGYANVSYGTVLAALASSMFMLSMSLMGLCALYDMTKKGHRGVFIGACILTPLLFPYSLYVLVFLSMVATLRSQRQASKGGEQ